jgi:hypothetical protein
MKRLIACSAMGLSLVAGSSLALANNPHSGGARGQPSQSCQMSLSTPGGAAGARGSPFNPSGVAGTRYAGAQPQNSNNPHSVSQYDVACFQQTQHGH